MIMIICDCEMLFVYVFTSYVYDGLWLYNKSPVVGYSLWIKLVFFYAYNREQSFL